MKTNKLLITCIGVVTLCMICMYLCKFLLGICIGALALSAVILFFGHLFVMYETYKDEKLHMPIGQPKKDGIPVPVEKKPVLIFDEDEEIFNDDVAPQLVDSTEL